MRHYYADYFRRYFLGRFIRAKKYIDFYPHMSGATMPRDYFHIRMLRRRAELRLMMMRALLRGFASLTPMTSRAPHASWAPRNIDVIIMGRLRVCGAWA